MNSFLSLKCALAVFLPGQPGLVFGFVCALPVFWIAFLSAEVQGSIREELLEGQCVLYLSCEEMMVDAASFGCSWCIKWAD